MTTRKLFSRRVNVSFGVIIAAALFVASCGGGSKSPAAISTGALSNSAAPTATTWPSGKPTAAELTEAARLVNIGDSPTPPPADVVECVAKVVVQNPPLDELANDIAQLGNGDLRQDVMYSYLQCGYNYIIDTYMRFAPKGLSKPELACVRSKFTQLNHQSMAEVIVLDPDAGLTGPLVIAACKTGSKSNPLLDKNGFLIGMGGS